MPAKKTRGKAAKFLKLMGLALRKKRKLAKLVKEKRTLTKQAIKIRETIRFAKIFSRNHRIRKNTELLQKTLDNINKNKNNLSKQITGLRKKLSK